MPKTHKILTYISIALLLVCCAMFYFQTLWQSFGTLLMSLFMLVEIGILETQRRENEAVVYYQKSCLWGLMDLFIALVFFYIIGTTIWEYATSVAHYQTYYALVFGYVAIRKLYIIQNYYYEK